MLSALGKNQIWFLEYDSWLWNQLHDSACLEWRGRKSAKEQMKMRNKLTIALLIVALVSVVAWNAQSQTSKPKNVIYQYDVIYDPTETMGQDEGLKKLNELGAQGWELAGVRTESTNYAPSCASQGLRGSRFQE